MRVGNVNIVRIRAAFIAVTTATTALSTATAGTLARLATTLTRSTATTTLIVRSHGTYIPAFVHIDLCRRDARISGSNTTKEDVDLLLTGQLLVLILLQHEEVLLKFGKVFLEQKNLLVLIV